MLIEHKFTAHEAARRERAKAWITESSNMNEEEKVHSLAVLLAAEKYTHITQNTRVRSVGQAGKNVTAFLKEFIGSGEKTEMEILNEGVRRGISYAVMENSLNLLEVGSAPMFWKLKGKYSVGEQ
jgi:hypothetical protein